MSEEHPPQLIESHITWLHIVQTVNLFEADREHPHMTSQSHNIRGVRFRFGYQISPTIHGTILSDTFHFSVACEPKTEVGKNWSCPVKLSFCVFTRNDEGAEIAYHTKNDVCSEFTNEAEFHNYTCEHLRIQELFAHYPTGSFLMRILIVVDPPSGIMSTLPYNGCLEFGTRTLAVNKELLSTHSDIFKKDFEANQHTINMDMVDTLFGGIEHFKVLYELLEHGSSSELNEVNIEGVLQLANHFKLHKVESLCATWINARNSGMSIPQKAILFDAIGASTSKYFSIKNAPKSEIGNNPARYVRSLHAAKSISYDQINEMQVMAREEL